MKTVQTYFILSSTSLTHCFWLITNYFAQIWEGGLWRSRVHTAVCPQGLPRTQGAVAGLGEPLWAGLAAAPWQSCTFMLCVLSHCSSPAEPAPPGSLHALGVSSWDSPRQTQPSREVLQFKEPAPSSQLKLYVRQEGCDYLLQSLR